MSRDAGRDGGQADIEVRFPFRGCLRISNCAVVAGWFSPAHIESKAGTIHCIGDARLPVQSESPERGGDSKAKGDSPGLAGSPSIEVLKGRNRLLVSPLQGLASLMVLISRTASFAVEFMPLQGRFAAPLLRDVPPSILHSASIDFAGGSIPVDRFVRSLPPETSYRRN